MAAGRPTLVMGDSPVAEGGFKQIFCGSLVTAEGSVPVAVAMSHEERRAETKYTIQREAEIHGRVCDHEHVLKLLHFFDDPEGPKMVLELIQPPGFDLFKLAVSYGGGRTTTMPVSEFADYFCQLADALEHLHDSCRVLHRDLHEGQVLIDNGCVKLSDFGLAATIEEIERNPAIRPRAAWGQRGTRYLAPECLKDDHPFADEVEAYGPEVDMWSLGAIIEKLYRDDFKNENFPEEVKECQQNLMKRSRKTRWTMAQLRGSAWLQANAEDTIPLLKRAVSADKARAPATESGAFGDIRVFSQRCVSVNCFIPAEWPADGVPLRDIDVCRVEGGDACEDLGELVWAPLLIEENQTPGDDFIYRMTGDLLIKSDMCLLLGIRGKWCEHFLHKGKLGLTARDSGNFLVECFPHSLEVDCFVFSQADVGASAAVLGSDDDARRARESGAPADTRALNFDAVHGVPLCGLAVKTYSDPPLAIEWVVKPQSLVRAGTLGLVPRIPIKEAPYLARSTSALKNPKAAEDMEIDG